MTVRIVCEGGESTLPPCVAPLTAAEFLAYEAPAPKLAIGAWLPMPGLAMICGPAGIGKSHLALSIAHAISVGGSALGWIAPAPRRCCFVDGEMALSDMQRRLRRTIARDERPADGLSILSAAITPHIPDLGNAAGRAAIAPHLAGFEVVILDNISCLFRTGAPENEAESWAPIQEWLLELKRGGTAVVLLHHVGKSGSSQRGTSKRTDIMDTVLRLERAEDYSPDQGCRFTAKWDKARGFTGADAHPIQASLDPSSGEWVVTTPAASKDQRVRDLKVEGYSEREIAETMGLSKTTVHRILSRSEGSH